MGNEVSGSEEAPITVVASKVDKREMYNKQKQMADNFGISLLLLVVVVAAARCLFLSFFFVLCVPAKRNEKCSEIISHEIECLSLRQGEESEFA